MNMTEAKLDPMEAFGFMEGLLREAGAPLGVWQLVRPLLQMQSLFGVAYAAQTVDCPTEETVHWIRQAILDELDALASGNDANPLLDTLLTIAGGISAVAQTIGASFIDVEITGYPFHPLNLDTMTRKAIPAVQFLSARLHRSQANRMLKYPSVGPNRVGEILEEVLRETPELHSDERRAVSGFLKLFRVEAPLSAWRALILGGILASRPGLKGIPYKPTQFNNGPDLPKELRSLPLGRIRPASFVHAAMAHTAGVGAPQRDMPTTSKYLWGSLRETNWADPAYCLDAAVVVYALATLTGPIGKKIDHYSPGLSAENERGPKSLSAILLYQVSEDRLAEAQQRLNNEWEEYSTWIAVSSGERDPVGNQVLQRALAVATWRGWGLHDV